MQEVDDLLGHELFDHNPDHGTENGLTDCHDQGAVRAKAVV